MVNLLSKIIFFIILVAGVAAVAARFLFGLETTNLTTLVPWGLWVLGDMFMSGVSVGSALLAAVFTFAPEQYRGKRIALLGLSLISLSGSLLFLLMDIGKPLYFWRPFFDYNLSSPMSNEIFVITGYGAVITVFLGMLVWKKKKEAAGVAVGIKTAEVAMAAVLALLSVYFRYEKGEIFFALSRGETMSGFLAVAIIVFGGIPGGLLISYFAVSGEKYSKIFRSLGIGLLTIVPFLIYYFFVFPALIEPVFDELPAAYFDSRFNLNYFPSAVEWLSTLGILAGCVFAWNQLNKLFDGLWRNQ